MSFKLSLKTGTAVIMLAVLAAFVHHPSQAETVIVSTIAGGVNEYGQGGFADGQGSAARFRYPYGIAIDAVGNLYVTDIGNFSIRKVTPGGEVSTLAGNGETGLADGQGNAARFKGPSGIAIDATGNLYVADVGSHSIRKVTPNGAVSTLAGGEEGFTDGHGQNARFSESHGIAIDAAGNLYVADIKNNRIRKVTPNGEVSTLVGSEKGFADGQGQNARFYGPFGIVIDAAENLYVTDYANHRIRKVTPKGEVSTLAGSGATGFENGGFADGLGAAARFNEPMGIAFDTTGNLYVADSLNYRIRKVTTEGEVSTLAGSEPGFADGEGEDARFHELSDIAIDAAGNLYVVDRFNHRIRKIVIQRP